MVRAGEGITRRPLAPLLRWAGGKRWLAGSIRAIGNLVCPSGYVEPFIGGGAVFLGATWPRPILGDANSALIRCYEGLATDPDGVRSKLSALAVDLPTHRRVVRWRPTSSTGCAVRLLYLNRTSFSGIYRENKKGDFNVPFAGDRGLSGVLSGDRLEEIGAAFGSADLRTGDFETTLSHVEVPSLVYCDPPYSLPGGEQGFRRYGRLPFTWVDQLRLAAVVRKLTAAGHTVLVSNSSHELVQTLYHGSHMVMLSRAGGLGKRSMATEQKEALYVMHSDETYASDIASLFVDCQAG